MVRHRGRWYRARHWRHLLIAGYVSIWWSNVDWDTLVLVLFKSIGWQSSRLVDPVESRSVALVARSSRITYSLLQTSQRSKISAGRRQKAQGNERTRNRWIGERERERVEVCWSYSWAWICCPDYHSRFESPWTQWEGWSREWNNFCKLRFRGSTDFSSLDSRLLGGSKTRNSFEFDLAAGICRLSLLQAIEHEIEMEGQGEIGSEGKSLEFTQVNELAWF